MEQIKRFIECLVPITNCNLKCSYCYIIQEGRRGKMESRFEYSPEHIGAALSKKRLGGTCYISICGAGETLILKEIPLIAEQILKQGHYVNITTNGTINERIDEITALPSPLLKRLHFAFSFHYLELVRVGKLDDFFENIKKVREAGCSCLVQLNLCDEYLPFLDQIKTVCEENTGAAPQLAVTRNEFAQKITLRTKYTPEEYFALGSAFESPLFDFTMKNFMVRRKEFCYAGDWSFKLYLDTGVMLKCYNSKSGQNIFKDLQKPIRFNAIGNHCRSRYCVNSSHFLSLGVIPGLLTPSYAALRDRPQAHWYSPDMKDFLNGKLENGNLQYGTIKKFFTNILEFWGGIHNAAMFKAKRRILKLKKGKTI